MPKSAKSTKFEQFVREFGVEKLARSLEIDPSAVYHWLQGRSIPDPKNAIKIQALAKQRGVALSLDQIYERTRDGHASSFPLKPVPARA